MALVKATLKDELLKLIDPDDPDFVGHPANSIEFANNWADAYEAYAVSAADASGDPLVTANRAGFVAALQLLNSPVGVIATAAASFDSAFVAYWTGAIFAVGTPPTPSSPCASVGGNGIWAAEVSSVVALVDAGTLQASMASLLAIPSADPQVKAAALADAFHIATTSAVHVLITGTDTTPPPAGPSPITNTCTIS
jgi:hypothetical protein